VTRRQEKEQKFAAADSKVKRTSLDTSSLRTIIVERRTQREIFVNPGRNTESEGEAGTF